MPNIIRTGGGTVAPPDTNTYLYKEGDECTALTGGWGAVVMSGYGAGTVTENADNIYLNAVYSGGQKLAMSATSNQINLMPYSKLCMEYTSIISTNAQLVLGAKATPSQLVAPAAYTTITESTSSKTIAILDISSLTSSLCVVVYDTAGSSGESVSANIYRVWFE
jgi:hypothetical protein